MLRLAHIYINESNIKQNLWDQKAKKRQKALKKDGILAWHKVSETIKGLKKKAFYFHTQVLTEQSWFLKGWAEVSKESLRDDKQQIHCFQLCILRLVPMVEGWTTSHQSGSQTPCDDVVGGPDSLGKIAKQWQKFSHLPCNHTRKQLIPDFWLFRRSLNTL